MQVKNSKLAIAGWTVFDQGVVSLGTFLVNVLLARRLSQGDYGTFALLLGGVYTLQVFTASLIFYPMSVRGAVLSDARSARLIGTSIVLVALLCIPLCVVFGAAIVFFGQGDIALAAIAFLFVSQIQEATRRALIARLRQKSAIVGDSISYLGQVAILAGMTGYISLNLENVFIVMAATSAVAALVQLGQQKIRFLPASRIWGVVKDYWSIGRWSLGNNIIWTMRAQLFPWALAMLHGPALAGLFQAALNVVNVANPVILGLCNIIPQIAAKALAQGREHAWHAIRSYMLIGTPPMLLYYAAVFIVPQIVLGVIYGPSSPYLEVATALRVLAIAAMMNYASEIICSYLHGVDEARLALVINGIGTGAVVVFAFPLTMAFGLHGACLAFALAGAVRLVASKVVLSGFVSNDQVHLA